MKRMNAVGMAVVMTVMLLAGGGLAFAAEIHDAARAGDAEKVRALLAASPELVNAKDNDGATPLHWAAQEGRKAVLFALLGKADVNARNKDGMTPLHLAAGNGGWLETKVPSQQRQETQKQVVVLLLANRADANARTANGWTPLHAAAEMGHEEVVALLLANKAEVDARDGKGRTPLFLAELNGRTDVVRLLRRQGATK